MSPSSDETGKQLVSCESKKRNHNLNREDEEEPMVIRRNRCAAERRFRADRQQGARRVRDERQEVMTVSTVDDEDANVAVAAVIFEDRNDAA